MTNIIYNGYAYDAETVAGYYDSEIVQAMPAEQYDNEQEFFDEYIRRDPGFTDLFKYDLYGRF